MQHKEEGIDVGLESESTRPQDRHQEVLHCEGTPLVAQGLRPHAPDVGGLGLIPAEGLRSHLPRKILQATTKTW